MMKRLALCLCVIGLAATGRSLEANGNVSGDFYTAIRSNDMVRLRAWSTAARR